MVTSDRVRVPSSFLSRALKLFLRTSISPMSVMSVMSLWSLMSVMSARSVMFAMCVIAVAGAGLYRGLYSPTSLDREASSRGAENLVLLLMLF